MRAFVVCVLMFAVACGSKKSGSEPDASTTDAAVVAVCGNNKVEPGEQCDDGNSTTNLLCDSNCQFTCGNGVVDTSVGETCDKGIAALADKARNAKLAIDDLTGGTFSITNGGIYGSMMSTPLLNYPQTGILGMHNIVKRAVVVDDKVDVRPMMYVALSYDHRVVDGREAVSFLVAVKERLEAPERLLLEV